ncbi:LOW QUALITY PROTEIN: abhydrolase domain-containing protein 12 [Geosmithia morbida]|uniref:Abhydrolase domain-containing protein 12 n=1 Tax=Geosmithia morbida TaxID=1094350 RepID=A0A9P4YYM4_9HYPO|nr:LOW QUALITY PROTEIN: abhydrolase domain-containing protein 12 [Geosmithia morbida]KAF4124917.1 LOW QUALITY PROTEIN: abhydrolase domain-containing protein 12 [Geosmithia morbida]
MAIRLHHSLRHAAWAVIVPLALYAIFLILAVNPFFQRHFVYAHKISSLLWSDLNNPGKWGFARNQVTPFQLGTADGETIYAWHILPLPTYLQNEDALSVGSPAFAQDVTQTESFKLLKEDPEAKVILNCGFIPLPVSGTSMIPNTSVHGGSPAHARPAQNAGHVAEVIRPATYHSLTATSNYHIITFDYRGYGHSTGSPDEAGLVEDGSAVVEWVMNVAGIPPERILLLGQSLGTAVASAVTERYVSRGVEFAGLVLVAGFSDLATMLAEYRIGGVFPVLAPLRSWPFLINLLQSLVVDTWRTDDRLASIVRNTKNRLRLSLVHAKNDADIPWTQDNKLFRAAVNEVVKIEGHEDFDAWKQTKTIRTSDDAFVTTWKSDPDVIVRQELFAVGGHNNIMTYAPLPLAIMRCFNSAGTGRSRGGEE